MLRAGIRRHIGSAQFGGIQGVAGRLRDGYVAGNNSDGTHVHVGRAQGHDQSDSVVGGGIGIDKNGPRHAIRIAGATGFSF
jgi:hypothetical protein